MKDRSTGRSRGFGFVTYANDKEALSALENMNEVELVSKRHLFTEHTPTAITQDGRRIRVNYAHAHSTSRRY